jgi:leucyl aminopeptidase
LRRFKNIFMKISKSSKVSALVNRVYLIDKNTEPGTLSLSAEENDLLQLQLKKDFRQVVIPTKTKIIFVVRLEEKNDSNQTKESARQSGNKTLALVNQYKLDSVQIVNRSSMQKASLDFAEGMALSAYRFSKFKKENQEENQLAEISIYEEAVSQKEVSTLQILVDAIFMVRDWVNLPVNYLNATDLAKAIAKAGTEAGFKTEIFDKRKITALKMGGLLAVNQGSVDPPTFTIMEYKPKNAVNKNPIVFVGKGVVYDTGGLSIKPTSNSMDYMKCDMAGAATITGAIYAAAKSKLPLHLIGLVPATDNRPGFNAFAPGDVITMFNGMTVEMLNSDAEGRMILADALSFAKKYKPELVIDAATLTGSAHAALGDYAIALMGTADEKVKSDLEKSGMEVQERLVEFPLWEEYGDLLKSDIADLKNVGGKYAGAITAGKFLEKFTDYPWIHLDIAGVAFFQSSMGYKGKNGSGFGVRLLYRFLEKRAEKK